MAKFVELKDAAQMLGLTPDQLVEMRSSGNIHGYRDGASWKFKEEEIARVKEELGGAGGNSGGLDLDDGPDESILVSEEELGHSGESISSTIIGKSSEAQADSDLTLSADEGSDLTLTGDSELMLGEPQGTPLTGDERKQRLRTRKIDSDMTLVPGVGTGSDVELVPDPGSDKEMGVEAVGDADSNDILGGDSELSFDDPGSSGLELSAGTGSDGGLELSADTGSGGGLELSADTGSGGDLDLALDSALALSDDDDMVLSGSGTGSDLSLSAADSGINLSSPTDSGLSLEADSGIQLQSPTDSGLSLEEEPLDLGGSSISSLELPEDDEVVELEDSAAVLDDSDTAAVQRDEEFLLAPSGEMFMDESDSGSQVIALEDSEAFDQDAATMLPAGADGQALLAETAGLEQQLDKLDGGGAPAMPTDAAPMPMHQGAVVEAPETPYSIWNIMGLLLVIIFLSLSGILMTDMMKNMWAWDEGGHDVATGISDGLTSAMGMTDD